MEETPYAQVIADYHDRIFLSQVGFTFDSSSLTEFELSLLRVIHKTTQELKKGQEPGEETDGGIR